MSEELGLVVVGGLGRMGRSLVELAAGEPGVSVAAIVDVADAAPDSAGGVERGRELGEALDRFPRAVVVDVALAAGAGERISTAAQRGAPTVVGVTDLHVDEVLADASARIPLVVAPNFSAGIALLARALEAVLGAEGPAWDVAVLDRHHRHKQDAPSGTARLLEETIARARGGETAPAAEVASFRQGGLVGEHAVYLGGDDEELVLSHRAFSRRVFARGALMAARFAAGARPGLYGMRDVLGIRS